MHQFNRMAVNKLALIRYKAIDACLRNRYRKWTLEDLMEKVADVLYEYEGISSGVSKRTIQADIQLMRSDKLGYNAPIVVKEKKYYAYDDPSYSITQMPISDSDVEKMKEVLGVLKQFNGFSYFEEMSDMIARLENNLYQSTQQSRNCIQFENNRLLKGIELIGPLYQAILHTKTLQIDYKSFQSKNATQEIYYPQLLKEYRNRWFLIVVTKKRKQLLTLALDRIIGFQVLNDERFHAYQGVDFDRYFSDLLGVTKNPTDRAHKIVLWVSHKHAPYVLTKPIHHSQQWLKEVETGILLRIDVVINFELERELLGFGECIKVLSPRNLASRMQRRAASTAGLYDVPGPVVKEQAG